MDAPGLPSLSLLGHPLRAGVLRLLMRNLPRPLGAGELAEALQVAPSTLSAHLSALTSAGLLALRRDGPARLYTAIPGALESAADALLRDLALGRAGGIPGGAVGKPRLLFLDDDNAGLSLLAEAVGRRVARGRFMVASAGLRPASTADPLVMEMLRARDHDTVSLVPEGTSAHAGAEVVIALSPSAAEALPVFADPLPVCIYWPMPEAPPGDTRVIPRAAALHGACRALEARMTALSALPLARLSRDALQAALDDLSSGLPEGGRAFASRREPDRGRPFPAPAAWAAYGPAPRPSPAHRRVRYGAGPAVS